MALATNARMEISISLYKRHRFPPEIIQYAVWLYHRFNLSHRDIEDLLAERNIVVWILTCSLVTALCKIHITNFKGYSGKFVARNVEK